MTATADRFDARRDAPPPVSRPTGDRFVAAGLLLLAGLFVVVQVLAGEVIPPLAVPAVLYAGFGLALLRWRPRWLLLTVAGLVVVHVVTSIPFIVGSLSHPETPATFLPDALIVIGAVTVAAAAAFGFRGGGTRARRRLTIGAGVAAVGAGAITALAAGQVTADPQQPGDVAVTAEQTRYPDRVELPTDGVLWVDNQDAFRHTLVVEGTDVHVELPGSASVRVPTDLEPGTYRYYCDVPGHERMQGELVVR